MWKTLSTGLSWSQPDSRLISLKRYMPALLLISLTVLVYARGLNNLFVAEDFPSVLDSKISFGEILSYIGNSVRTRPIVYLFQWLMTQLFDMNSVGAHAFMLLFHTIGTVLLLRFVTTITENEKIGFIAAVIFAVYPRHHQPVLWFSANQFTIMGMLSLTCMIAFYRFLTVQRRRWQVLALIAFTLMLITHESGVIFLLLLGLLELFVHPGHRGLKALLGIRFYYKYVPFVVIMSIYLLITFGGPRLFKLTGVEDPAALSQLTSVGGAGETYRWTGFGPAMVKDMGAYVTYLIFPFIPLRSMDATNPINLVLAVIAAVLVLTFLLKGNWVVRFGIIWALLAFVPFVLFVPFGNADRYFYLSAIGFSIAVSSLLYRFFERIAPLQAIQGVSVVVALYALFSILFIQARIDDWRSAGETAADIVNQAVQLYPNPVPDSKFLLVGLPTSYGQAYIFEGGGVGSAILLAYGEQDRASDMDIYQSRDTSVMDYLLSATEVENPLSDVYVLLYQDGRLVDKSGFVDDMEALQVESWSR